MKMTTQRKPSPCTIDTKLAKTRQSIITAPGIDTQTEAKAHANHSFGAISVFPSNPSLQRKPVQGVVNRRPIFNASSQEKSNSISELPVSLRMGSRNEKFFHHSGPEILQRRIVSTPLVPGPQIFVRRGRSGPHNTAANRTALSALRADRAANANPGLRHVNNEFETAIGAALPVPAGPVPLHIAHHVSDQTVQDTVAGAANAHNMGAAAWGPVVNLINGIDPAGAPVALPPNFIVPANAAHVAAGAALGPLMGAAFIPHNAASRLQLTTLANSIANSPMNLHHGSGQANMSIGGHGDANSFPTPMPAPLLNRRLTWRSFQMLNAVGGVPMNYRTHAAALGMPGTVAAAHAGAFPVPPAYVGPAIVHSSGAGFGNFAALQ